MRIKRSVTAIVLFVVVVFILTCYFLPIIGQKIRLANADNYDKKVDPERHLLFCDLLRTGLSIAEVRVVLSQFGTFSENIFEDYSNIVIIGIIFDDPLIQERFGGNFKLNFINNRFEKATYYRYDNDSAPFDVIYNCNLSKYAR